MARHTTGWFKIWREAWEKDLSQNVWLWGIWNALLHMAVWKETQVIWEGKQRKLPPGSVVLGMRELAVKWQCSPSTIKRWLHYLHDTGRIVLEVCPRGSLATICNWELYQLNEESECTQSAHKVDTDCSQSVHKVALNKKVRKKEERINTAESKSETKPPTGVGVVYTQEFETTWEAYGRVGKKIDAYKAFQESALNKQELEQLARAISNYLLDCRQCERTQMYLGTFLREDWMEWLKPKHVHSSGLYSDLTQSVDGLEMGA